MPEQAVGTLSRAGKGPIAPPPTHDGLPQAVADAVAAWPGVAASVHWHLFRPSEVDGIDFYFGDEEFGHIHLDAWTHIATSSSLGATLVGEGRARPFRHLQGWIEARVATIGADAAVALFRRNYERLTQAG